MTSEELIQEGRKIQRPTVFLRPQGTGDVAAVWHQRDEDLIESTGFHCWMTVDARRIPGLPIAISGYLSLFADEEGCEGGHIEVLPSWPERDGTPLYAHDALVLPPIDAVYARGSEMVGDWIGAHGWQRNDRYNDNFPDAAAVSEYERTWMDEFPLYSNSDVYAVLGGWHWPCADDDWHDLLDEHLMIMTLHDAEPWVEAWRTQDGRFHVIQRIT